MAFLSDKPDYPPLLDIGRHSFTLAALRELCVDGFPDSTTRPTIMQGLESVTARLSESTITGELWIDGSFLTQKINANDCDVILRVQGDFYDNAEQTTRDVMDWFSGNLRESHLCDSYLHFEYERADDRYWLGEYMYAYWMKQWGFDHGNDLKGIAVVGLPI